jgi:hypothetical protein
MATYAREKAARQSLLRQVRSKFRTWDSRIQQLDRCLQRKRRARTMLDPEDLQEIYHYTDQTLDSLGQYQTALGALATYIGRA